MKGAIICRRMHRQGKAGHPSMLRSGRGSQTGKLFPGAQSVQFRWNAFQTEL